jgi:capsular polysaccharide transport system permease protein
LPSRRSPVNRPLLSYPAVTALDTVLARFILQALTGLAVAALVFSGILAVFADQVHLQPVPLITAFALAGLLGLGVGLVNTTLFALSKSWELAYGVISRPLFLVSAVFFTFASLPAIYDDSHVSGLYVLALSLGLVATGLALMLACANKLAEQ